MKELLLHDLTIMDLTGMLPGPYATYMLSHLGAKIIKIEDENYPDPFNDSNFAKLDQSFGTWYKNLNANKEIWRWDLGSASCQDEFFKRCESCDALILTERHSFLEERLLLQNRPHAIVYLGGSAQGNKSLHDLNALARTGLLAHYLKGKAQGEVVAPPFLPIAGITFGMKIAIDILASFHRASKDHKSQISYTYLYETTEEALAVFWDGLAPGDYLHNGAFPCYNIYSTKDGRFIAMAALEAKFWNGICERFKINLKEKDRFDHKHIATVQNVFSKLSTEKISEIISQELDLCFDLV